MNGGEIEKGKKDNIYKLINITGKRDMSTLKPLLYIKAKKDEEKM